MLLTTTLNSHAVFTELHTPAAESLWVLWTYACNCCQVGLLEAVWLFACAGKARERQILLSVESEVASSEVCFPEGGKIAP